MAHHDLSSSTHTPELHQLRELNEHLAAASAAGTPVTADPIGLAGQPVQGVGGSAPPEGLPASAVLDRLSAQGPPDFPYIAGVFRTTSTSVAGTGDPPLQVAMHSDALRRLSHHFGLRHVWGA